MIQSPTRITRSSSSLLDVFLTNSPSFYDHSYATPYGYSDHHLIVTHLHPRGMHSIAGHTYAHVRSFNNLDLEALSSALWSDEWRDILQIDDVDDCAKRFTMKMQSLLNEFVPSRKIRVKTQIPPWCKSPLILEMRRVRNRLHHAALRTGLDSDWLAYRWIRNRRTGLLRSA